MKRSKAQNESTTNNTNNSTISVDNTNNSNTTVNTSKSTETKLLVDSTSKWKSAWVRGYTTLLMLGGFILLIYLGHIALLLFILFIQIMMFKEIKRLSRVLSTKAVLPSFRPLHWYWFFSAIFFSYGRVLINYFNIMIPYHTLISFLLYISGFIAFVSSLIQGYYKYQFELFAWVQITLILVVLQSIFIVINMFQGLIWFILPALLIISNDTWAYVVGFFIGRTPLIALSPKKTVEGFIGAALATLLTGFTLPILLSQYNWLICPKTELTFGYSDCSPAPVFLPTEYILPELFQSIFNRQSIQLIPMQFHGLFLSIFASCIAPFGGFFASGFKRAFQIKDFGESIPGHGGVTDRMDCQIMMGLFTYVYYWSFVIIESTDIQSVITAALTLTQTEQIQLIQYLKQNLIDNGVDINSISTAAATTAINNIIQG